MHTRLPWALAAACMTLTLAACTKTPSADARLQSIYSEEWKWREQQFADDEDAQKAIKKWEDSVGEAELAGKWRVAPGWLDRG